MVFGSVNLVHNQIAAPFVTIALCLVGLADIASFLSSSMRVVLFLAHTLQTVTLAGI